MFVEHQHNPLIPPDKINTIKIHTSKPLMNDLFIRWLVHTCVRSRSCTDSTLTYRTHKAGVVPCEAQSLQEFVPSFDRKITTMTAGPKQVVIIYGWKNTYWMHQGRGKNMAFTRFTSILFVLISPGSYVTAWACVCSAAVCACVCVIKMEKESDKKCLLLN